jgi:hypothetical protein
MSTEKESGRKMLAKNDTMTLGMMAFGIKTISITEN